MRVLAASQSCVVDINQLLFIALSNLPGVSVELLVPAHWRSEYTFQPMTPTLHPGVTFPVRHLPVIFPGNNSLHAYRRLPLRALDAFAPEIVYSTMEPWSLSNLQLLLLARRWRVPFFFHTNQNLNKSYPPPFRWFERLSYRTAAVALAYSEEARQVLHAKGLRGASQVVPYGTDLARFHAGREETRRAELRLGSDVVVGYLGRFVPEKGLDLLLDAMDSLRRRGIELKALLVGTGPEEATLRKMAADRRLTDRVVFGGMVPHQEAPAYLRCMDLLVLPSRTRPHWKEQFGRVLIEALATGIPVVGSESGEIPNLIRATGGGLVFREGDALDLAEKITSLVADPALRMRLAAAGSAVVRERYTFEAVAQQLHALFRTAQAREALRADKRKSG